MFSQPSFVSLDIVKNIQTIIFISLFSMLLYAILFITEKLWKEGKEYRYIWVIFMEENVRSVVINSSFFWVAV